MPHYYTIEGLTVQQDGEVWALPALLGAGNLERGSVTFRVAEDGLLCHPFTEGLGEAQQEPNVYRIEPAGRLAGWGELDCEQAYRIVGAGALVPGPLLAQVAELAGFDLPGTPGYVSLPNKLRAALRAAEREGRQVDHAAIQWLRGAMRSTTARQALDGLGADLDELAEALWRGGEPERADARRIIDRAAKATLQRAGWLRPDD